MDLRQIILLETLFKYWGGGSDVSSNGETWDGPSSANLYQQLIEPQEPKVNHLVQNFGPTINYNFYNVPPFPPIPQPQSPIRPIHPLAHLANLHEPLFIVQPAAKFDLEAGSIATLHQEEKSITDTRSLKPQLTPIDTDLNPPLDLKNKIQTTTQNTSPTIAAITTDKALAKMSLNQRESNNSIEGRTDSVSTAQQYLTNNLEKYIKNKGVQIPTKEVEIQREQMEIPSQQMEFPRKQEILRKQFEIPRKQVDIPRKQMEIPRKQMEIPRKHVEIPRQQMKIPRKQFEITRKQFEIPKKEMQIDQQNTSPITFKPELYHEETSNILEEQDIERQMQKDSHTNSASKPKENQEELTNFVEEQDIKKDLGTTKKFKKLDEKDRTIGYFLNAPYKKNRSTASKELGQFSGRGFYNGRPQMITVYERIKGSNEYKPPEYINLSL